MDQQDLARNVFYEIEKIYRRAYHFYFWSFSDNGSIDTAKTSFEKKIFNYYAFYLLSNSHGTGAKGDALAEAFMPPGDRVTVAEPYVFSVHLVKRQRGQIVGAGAGRSGSCNSQRKCTGEN